MTAKVKNIISKVPAKQKRIAKKAAKKIVKNFGPAIKKLAET
jgi:hypothetical protein